MIGTSNLPDEYRIPKGHAASAPRTFDDNAFMVLHVNAQRQLVAESDTQTITVRTYADFVRLFQARYTWFYSKQHEIDCAFKVFTFDQLSDLSRLGKFTHGDDIVSWFTNTSKISLIPGRYTRETKTLINIAPFVHREVVIEDLAALKHAVERLRYLDGLIPLNPTSPAATVKDLLLTDSPEEFDIFSNKLSLDWTKFLHSCYVGPRMESRCLGTIEGAGNVDLVKAYLRELGRCPSTARNSLLRVARGTTFFPDAHPGSGYEIEVDVPFSYHTFAPIPLKRGMVMYPTGKFVTRVSKPYIDLLEELGDIPYRILDAIQLIPIGKPTYPFATLTDALEEAEDNLKDALYPINLKALHRSLVGHMLHIHKEYKKDHNGHIDWYYQASSDYNPVMACAVQAKVAVDIWRLAQASNTEAIRVDAITGYDLPDLGGFKRTEPGLMTFLTPALKDKPGSSLYRDLIHRDRDMYDVRVRFPYREGIQSAYNIPGRIGITRGLSFNIPPGGGNRLFAKLDKSGRPRRVGELLDARLPLLTPSVETATEEFTPNWVDDYLNRFPQSMGGPWGFQGT